MARTTKNVICRACHAQCGLLLNFEDGIPINSHGDKDNPAYHGYSCLKGRELFRYHASPSRLLTSMKLSESGAHRPISWMQAASESAGRLRSIIDRFGPASVAMFVGTFGYNDLVGQAFGKAFLDAIGSHMFFTAVTIDQPGKIVASAEHGSWIAGQHRISEWDGLLMVGVNPLISMNGGLGVNPGRSLHRAKQRGMELIVIDPRRSESAARADLFLQVRPGEDTAVLGAIAKLLIESGQIDHEFIAKETEGLDFLITALTPFDVNIAAARAGVNPDDIRRAAQMIGTWKRGHFCGGTGANMSGFGNIIEYLCLILSSLKGFWLRAGELRRNAGTFIHPPPPLAAASGAFPATGIHKMRTRDLPETLAGMPTSALADEILTPGEGQIKALIVHGGNPVLAWPDQIKTVKAMKELDLLICIDPRMSKTCEYADYIIAPKIHYEKSGTSALNEMLGVFGAGWGFDETYGQVCEPVLDTPEGSELCEDYEFFAALAENLELPLSIASFAYAMDPVKQAEDRIIIQPGEPIDPMVAWCATLHGAPCAVDAAFADLEMHKGRIKPGKGTEIVPKPEGWTEKLVLGSPFMMGELGRYQKERLCKEYVPGEYPFRLISRRLSDIHNSNWHELPSLRKRLPHHPAFMNPQDMDRLGIRDGQIIRIRSQQSGIECVTYPEDGIKEGCVSVPHAWGTTPDEADDPLGSGGNTGRLCEVEKTFDQITGQPIMSAIPVHIVPT